MKNTKHPIQDALTEIAEHQDITVLTSDIAESTKTGTLAKTHPSRFINTGASGHLSLLLAIGLSLRGKKPVVITYAATLELRLVNLARKNNANITIIASHSGISTAQDGNALHATHDTAHLRAIPTLTLIEPADSTETRRAIIASASRKEINVIRLGKEIPEGITDKHPFLFGKANTIRLGKDCTLIASGNCLPLALRAEERLNRQGITCTVINNSTLSPIDTHTLLSALEETGCGVTIEEHNKHSGTGHALSARIKEPIEKVGLSSDTESGTRSEILGKHGITVEHIIASAKKAIARKCQHTSRDKTTSPHTAFRLQNGKTIHSLGELAATIATLDDATYTHHANNTRNDFAQWIHDVFGEKTLAQEVASAKNKLASASTIHRWLK